MRLYKMRRRPYKHIIPKHEILNIKDDITSEGGAYAVVFKISDLDNVKENIKEWESLYTKIIEDSFDAIDRIIQEKHHIDFDYVNIDKVNQGDEELIVLYVTAKELGVNLKEEGEQKFKSQTYENDGEIKNE